MSSVLRGRGSGRDADELDEQVLGVIGAGHLGRHHDGVAVVPGDERHRLAGLRGTPRRGAGGDVSETAAPWSKLREVHDHAYAAAQKAFDQLGRTGWIMSHLSHSYHSGACLYFTFAFVFGDDPIAEYDLVKSAIQQSFVDSGATISHHHGVGIEHAPWLAEDVSPEGVKVMSGLFAATDPGSNFNPRKITD